MAEYQIICDGASDLYSEFIFNNNLKVVEFYVAVKPEIYQKERTELKVRDFYQSLVDNPKLFPKTSCPTIKDYTEVFTEAVKAGKDIICITISSDMSGSFNSANVAKQNVLDNFPNSKITVIDSRCNTVTEGLLVKEALRKQSEGEEYDTLVKKIEACKKTGRIYFTVNGVEYLVSGGRIGKIAQLLKGILKINLCILMKDGNISSKGIAISRKRATIRIRDLVKKSFVKDKLDKEKYRFAAGYCYDKKEAEEFVTKSLPFIERDSLELEQIGSTVGVHTGPTALGIGYIKKME